MATTYSTILNNVCILSKETQPSAFSSTNAPYPELKKYIVDVLGDICTSHAWTFLEREYSLSTVNGTREYTLPADLEVKNILTDGVRRSDWTPPLYYVQDSILDQAVLTSGAPIRYSGFNNQLILDPTPDAVYTIPIKYRTIYYAYSAANAAKATLALTDDYTVIPDRFLKALEYGAAAMYRGNFRPDEKFQILESKYQGYLKDLREADGFGGDAYPSLVIGRNNKNANRMLIDSFRQASR